MGSLVNDQRFAQKTPKITHVLYKIAYAPRGTGILPTRVFQYLPTKLFAFLLMHNILLLLRGLIY